MEKRIKCKVPNCNNFTIDRHHIKTRKAGGADDDWNLIELCRKHHTEIHRIGSATFIEKYSMQSIFEQRGWEIEYNFGRKRLVRKVID
jgi:hypothetical protein